MSKIPLQLVNSQKSENSLVNVAKLLCRSYPIFKKRTAISFFFQDVRSNECDEEIKTYIKDLESRNRKPHLRTIWNNLDPGKKLRYYQLAKLDHNRFKEQTSLWITKVANVIESDEPNKIEILQKCMPSGTDLAMSTKSTLDSYKKRYSLVINADGINSMTRNLIRRVKQNKLDMNEKDLISAVPETFRPIMNKPLPPKVTYCQFIADHNRVIKRYRMRNHPDTKFFQVAAIMWRKLPKHKKDYYKNLHEEHMKKYLADLEKYRASQEHAQPDEVTSSKVAKVRRNMSKNLRHKMRKSTLIPIFVRNSYIYFLMDNAHLMKNSWEELNAVFHSLSDEQRAKYENMSEADRYRYAQDKYKYTKFVNQLLQIMDDKELKSKQ